MGIATFAAQAIEEFQSTAAIAPSSRFLADAMAGPLPLAQAKTVVEFGPGTGVMTRALLDRLPHDARLLSFEINPRFIEYLGEEFVDPRLEIVPIGAENVMDELSKRGLDRADAVLSSLGLSLMPKPLVQSILEGASKAIGDWGVFTQFQYFHRMRLEDGRPSYYDVGRALPEHFGSIQRRMIVRNLPPAFVYECRTPRRS